jgi:sodium-dependent phosphate cotransporter
MVQSRHWPAYFKNIQQALSLGAFLYLFLVSIKLLGTGFEMFGGGFAERLISSTSNPFVGLFIGILATSLVQSSSTTTCTVVGFVAAGILSLENAVPIVMGANIGTTVTSTIVSMGHVTRREEFRRAMGAATVHDFFNVLTVIVLFPLELATGFLRHSAQAISTLLVGTESVTFASPVKKIVTPAVAQIVSLISRLAGEHAAVVVAIISVVLLLLSLYFIVAQAKNLALKRVEVVLDRLMGKSGAIGILVGCGVTAIIQSSSVTTSLLVPLAGAGIVRLEQIFPIALGANMGTTVTALLASLAGDARGLTIAIVHLLFNICGILLVYPFRPIRRIPIFLATRLANFAAQAKGYTALLYILGLFFALPALLILLSKLF